MGSRGRSGGHTGGLGQAGGAGVVIARSGIFQARICAGATVTLRLCCKSLSEPSSIQSRAWCRLSPPGRRSSYAVVNAASAPHCSPSPVLLSLGYDQPLMQMAHTAANSGKGWCAELIIF